MINSSIFLILAIAPVVIGLEKSPTNAPSTIALAALSTAPGMMKAKLFRSFAKKTNRRTGAACATQTTKGFCFSSAEEQEGA